jgi:RNA polymerase sigma-70 factor (ECF subfamily)
VGRSKLSNVTDPGSYVYVIAKNHALDLLEKMSTQKKGALAISGKLSVISNVTEETISYKDSSDLVANAVQHLPRRQQVVYRLSKEEGLAREEIAQRLKISPHTVKNHLDIAIQTIRQYLRKHGKFAGLFLFLHFL